MNKAKEISQTTIELLIIIGIVIVANILGQFYYARADLTEDKQYTLAASSKEVVSEIPDIVRLKAYISSELPPVLKEHEQRLRDLLDEYRASGSTRLIIQFIDPNDLNEEEVNALQMKGIQEIPIQIRESDELTYRNVYFALEIEYLDKYEVIPDVPFVQNLEYDITSSVLKLISEETPTIGFLTGHGEMSTSTNYTQLAEILKELYNVQDVDLGNGRKIQDNINTLIIAQPTEPYSERHRYVIDQFVMRGGKLVVLASGVQMDQMSEQAQFLAFPLESLMAAYGIKVNNDLIADLAFNWKVQGGNMGGFRVLVDYPLFPVITQPEGFPSDSPVTRGLDSMIIPFASSVDLLYDKISDETEILELAKTSEHSFSYPVPVNLSTQQDFAAFGTDLKKQLAIVQLNGVFTSAFQGQPVPAMDSVDPEALPEMDDEPMLTTSQSTSIVFAGNATFIDDNTLGAPGNGVFIQNLIEALNIGDKLIDIRTRTVTSRPLNPDLTTSQKNGFKFWGYVFVPLLVTVIGIARFYVKGQRKKLLAAIYQAEQKD